MEITLEPGYEDQAELEQLFGEYMDMLLCRQPDFQGYLALQHYDTELEQLREKYGPPDGRLYLARADGAAAGCVALRRIDGESCELKRLYVRPAFRGHGLAGRLVDQVIADARDAGYRAVLPHFQWKAEIRCGPRRNPGRPGQQPRPRHLSPGDRRRRG